MMILEPAKQWWDLRTRREQWMLAGLGVVAAGMVGWYGVVVPVGMLGDYASDKRAQAEAELRQVEAAAKVQAGQASAPAAPGKSLSDVIDLTATAAGVGIERRREEAGDRVTVWVASVEPRVLMQWIAALKNAQGVAVVGLTAEKADAANLEVEIAFAREGA